MFHVFLQAKLRVAEILLADKKYEMAVSAFKNALELEPDNPKIVEGLETAERKLEAANKKFRGKSKGT